MFWLYVLWVVTPAIAALALYINWWSMHKLVSLLAFLLVVLPILFVGEGWRYLIGATTPTLPVIESVLICVTSFIVVAVGAYYPRTTPSGQDVMLMEIVFDIMTLFAALFIAAWIYDGLLSVGSESGDIFLLLASGIGLTLTMLWRTGLYFDSRITDIPPSQNPSVSRDRF